MTNPIQHAIEALEYAIHILNYVENYTEFPFLTDALAGLRSIKPATDEEMEELIDSVKNYGEAFRAAEKFHGIRKIDGSKTQS